MAIPAAIMAEFGMLGFGGGGYGGYGGGAAWGEEERANGELIEDLCV